jgi:hypothetical protein
MELVNKDWGEDPVDVQTTHVETTVWVPNPDKPGYLLPHRRKTIREVCDELRAITGECPEGCTEGFSVPSWTKGDDEWPQGQTVVYAVTGGSEGHWVHVEIRRPFSGKEETTHAILGKTFDGFDAAWAFAKRLATLLQV